MTVQVDIWLTDVGASTPDDQAELLAMLSPHERGRIAEIALPALQTTQLVARALVRTTLARYCDLAAADLRFACSPHGKPHVMARADMRVPFFNLSHSGRFVVCAVCTESELGVDIEPAHRRGSLSELIADCLAAEEATDVLTRAADARERRFFQYWTLKEAYAKATGRGLRVPFRELAFRLEPAPTLTSAPPGMPRTGVCLWQALVKDYWLALALLSRQPGSEVRVRKYVGAPLREFVELPDNAKRVA